MEAEARRGDGRRERSKVDVLVKGGHVCFSEAFGGQTGMHCLVSWSSKAALHIHWS